MATCQTPEMEPGTAEAETTVADSPPANVNGRFKGWPGFGVIAPVACAGEVPPRPSRKIWTTDPGAVGFAHEFLVPSALNANGSGPPVKERPLIKGQLASDASDVAVSIKATGLLATSASVRESERLI